MKLTAYIILVAWVAALAAFSYFLFSASRDARAELSRAIWNTPGAPAIAEIPVGEQLAAAGPNSVPPEVRARLSAGLESLTGALESYQVRLAEAAESPSSSN
jgi:hypothetical protein